MEENRHTNEFQYDQTYSQLEPQEKGKPVLGIIGAIGGALIGAALWVIIYQLGFIAGIAGFITIICAMKGFELLGRQPVGKLGTILCIVVSLIMILVANCLCYSIEIYKVFAKDYYLTLTDCIALLPGFMEDGEVMRAFLKDLLIGYVLMIAASFSAIRAGLKKN